MRNRLTYVLCMYAAVSTSACGLILDFDPPDETFRSVDGSMLDAGVSGDSGTGHLDGSDADGSILADADAGDLDAETTDSGLTDSGPPDPCELHPDICLRYTDMSTSPVLIMGYWFTYATADGLAVEPWRSSACIGSIRHEDRTSYCLMPGSERETGRTMFVYASYTVDGSRSICNSTGCPRDDFEVWVAGRALTPVEISQDRGWTRPPLPPSGMTFVITMNTP